MPRTGRRFYARLSRDYGSDVDLETVISEIVISENWTIDPEL